jgi:hypothetical protein
VTFGRTLNGEERASQLRAEQQHALRKLQAAIDAGDGVRLVAGRLELSPPEALDESPAALRLRSELDRLTPRIDIPDLLAEVEQWTGFTGHLTHAAGATPRMADLQQHLHAALLASGLNLGPTRMAECCAFSYRQLAWATEWYIGDEQLRGANDVLVDYLHQLQLAAHWGTGRFSSSDGQRSPARGRGAPADAMAREFGFRRGALNLVNWDLRPVQPIRHEGRIRRRTRSDPHPRGDPAHPATDPRAHDRHARRHGNRVRPVRSPRPAVHPATA